MKTIFGVLALSCAVSSIANAETVQTVRSLDNGMCWGIASADNDEVKSWRFASFADNVAGDFDERLLELNGSYNQITQTFTDQGLEAPSLEGQTFEISFHCSDYGHFFLFNFHDAEKKFCVHASLSGKGPQYLKIAAVTSNADAERGKPCVGAVPGELLIGLRDGVDQEAVSRLLRAVPIIADFRYSEISRLFTVKLRKDFFFKEKEAIDEMNRREELSPYIASVTLNFVVMPRGELVRLFALVIQKP